MEDSSEKTQEITLELGIKVWLKGFDDFTLGQGDVSLLRSLQSTRNLTKSAEVLQYSYKYAWQKLKSISKKTGLDVAHSKKGGSGGGGTVNLTDWGRYLLACYDHINTEIELVKKKINIELENMQFISKKSIK